MLRTLAISTIALLTLNACGVGQVDQADEVDADDAELATLSIPEGSPEAVAILQLVNGLSASDLHARLGVTTTAAKAIVKHRAGADGTLGTADDQPYTTISALEHVSGVGNATMKKLLAVGALARQIPAPWPNSGTFQGSYTTTNSYPIEANWGGSCTMGSWHNDQTTTTRTISARIDETGAITLLNVSELSPLGSGWGTAQALPVGHSASFPVTVRGGGCMKGTPSGSAFASFANGKLTASYNVSVPYIDASGTFAGSFVATF